MVALTSKLSANCVKKVGVPYGSSYKNLLMVICKWTCDIVLSLHINNIDGAAMKKYIVIVFIFFLSACGGGNSSNTLVQPTQDEVRLKVEDAPDHLDSYCDLYDNLDFINSPNIIYVDEVISAHCSGSASDNDLVLDNLDFFKNIEVLSLGGGGSYLNSIDVLPKLKKLNSLAIGGRYDASPEMWKQLNLISLSLNDSDVSSTKIPPISNIAYLQKLELATDVNVDLSGLSNLTILKVSFDTLDAANISSLANLKELELTGGNGHTDVGSMTLQGELTNLPKLETLVMDQVSIRNFDFIKSFDLLKRFNYTDVQSSLTPSFTDEFIFIACGKSLTDLSIRNVRGLRHHFDFRNCKNLENLEIISSNISSTLGFSLLNQESLKRLNISYNNISDITWLFDYTNLIKIDLSFNNISPEDIKILRTILPNTEVIFTPFPEKRVIDTEMWTFNACNFYYSDTPETYIESSGFAYEPSFSEIEKTILVADITRIVCADEFNEPDITLPDIGLFENLESLTLGRKNSSMSIASLDKLIHLSNLKSLTLNSYANDTSPDTWEQLKLESLTIDQSDILPLVSNIKTLKFLEMSFYSHDQIKNLSNLENLIELRVEFGNPGYIDVDFIQDLTSLKKLTLSVWRGEIGGFFSGLARENTENFFPVKNFEALSTLPNLTMLTINNLAVTDFSVFVNFHKLFSVKIHGVNSGYHDNGTLPNITTFQCGKDLRILNISNDNMPVVAFDPSCNSLTKLILTNNNIEDISSFNLFNLESLVLSQNNLKNPSPDILSKINNLVKLDLLDNPIKIISIPSILSLNKLKVLKLSGFIEDISQFSNSQLEELQLSYLTNSLTDYSQLVCGTKLKKLNLSDNIIQNIFLDPSCENLESLNLERNEISDLSPLSNFNHLKELYLTLNNISDITPLLSLINLENLSLIYGNEISDESILNLKEALGLKVVH